MALASSVTADMGTLVTGATTVMTMLVLSTIVTTVEAALWTLEEATDVSADLEPLESTVRETTEMNACTILVGTTDAVLTRLETTIATVTKHGRARTVMSMMYHHREVLT